MRMIVAVTALAHGARVFMQLVTTMKARPLNYHRQGKCTIGIRAPFRLSATVLSAQFMHDAAGAEWT